MAVKVRLALFYLVEQFINRVPSQRVCHSGLESTQHFH